MSEIGYRWWRMRCWVAHQPDRFAWWLAWRVPRRVALYAFVRVFGATITELSWDTNGIYKQCYDGWERGAGK